MNKLGRLIIAAVLPLIAWSQVERTVAEDLAAAVRDLDAGVLTNVERQSFSGMVARDIERRRRLAIQRENREWADVESLDDWQRFRDQRLNALRESLGQFPPLPKQLNVETTAQIQGEGYRIENIVFESRPGLFVTANLYLPAKPSKSMPGILLSHSHHNPKSQGELQDMGVNWARKGSVVLVMDLLGHGERRQHPFVSGDQYPKPFRVGRQDYYFRYHTGLQLQLVGESLIGWMVWDLMRGVDLLCSRDGVDEDRIILIGSVAGGGDPAGVAAALDPRIAAVAPFNFGGPQPDYAIPADAENEFYYFGVAYWETTRCLRLGGRDGFAHWTIVGSVAPRRLVYSHEFDWDRERDPVWPRLEKVFGLYGARDHLAVATGRGNLKGSPPESTHCNNVGVYQRRRLYPHLQRWFAMDPPAEEFQQRHEPKELICLTPAIAKKLDPQPVYKLAGRLADERVAAARRQLQSLGPAESRKRLCKAWTQMLGDMTPAEDPTVLRWTKKTTGDVAVERVLLEVEDGIVVPLVLVSSAALNRKANGLHDGQRQPARGPLGQRSNEKEGSPTVVVVARAGKQRILAARAEEFANLIAGGAVVCLPDLRGTGETSSGSSVGPGSTDTALSCRDQVLGQTLLGSRLRDLRSVLRYLRSGKRNIGPIALWGDSLAEVNPQGRGEAVPHGVDNPNVQAEPSGGLLALLGALFEDDVQAVYATGTFAGFRSLLSSRFLYVPHDTVVPGILAEGDLSDIAAALAPRPLRMENLVDGLNRQVSLDELKAAFAPATEAFDRVKASDELLISAFRKTEAAAWLLSRITR